MKYVIAVVLMSLLPTFANAQVSEAQAQHCIFDPIVIGQTTIEQAECTLSKRGFIRVNTFEIKDVRLDTYQYRSARFERTSLVFKNRVLVQIHKVGTS
jgi:hypothetical protein